MSEKEVDMLIELISKFLLTGPRIYKAATEFKCFIRFCKGLQVDIFATNFQLLKFIKINNS